jgi:hypothetical protein
VAAVRSALLRLFDGFVLHRDVPVQAHVELIGEYWIEPIVSQQAVEGYEKLRPVLGRKPLEQAENNYAEAFVRHRKAVFEAEYELELSQYCMTARAIHFSAIGKSVDLFAKPWRPC